ncbi:MAG: SDR family oxidoreductase [Candidatus Poribacteria bacterium]
MPKFLVTGGAGFIGSNIVRELVKRGEFVRVLDNFATGRPSNLEGIMDKIEFIQGDIRNLELVKEAVKRIDFVLHQAALPSVSRSVNDPISTNETNITGTLNVLIASKDAKVKRVIYASSSSVYGNTLILPKKEDMTPNPQSPYAITKYAGEQYCKVFHSIYGLETVILRYFNVFGPRQNPNSQYSAAIPLFIKAFLTETSPVIYGDGEQSRDFTFVENVVSANLLACCAEGVAGKVFNIACGRRVSINDLVFTIRSWLNSDMEPTYKEARKGDVQHSLADISKAQQFLKYEPKVNLEEGLKITIEWFKQEFNKQNGT